MLQYHIADAVAHLKIYIHAVYFACVLKCTIFNLSHALTLLIKNLNVHKIMLKLLSILLENTCAFLLDYFALMIFYYYYFK